MSELSYKQLHRLIEYLKKNGWTSNEIIELIDYICIG